MEQLGLQISTSKTEVQRTMSKKEEGAEMKVKTEGEEKRHSHMWTQARQ